MSGYSVVAAVYLLRILSLVCSSNAQDTEIADNSRYITAYKVGLKLKLQEQLQVVKKIEKFNDEIRTKFLNTSFTNILNVFSNNRVQLEGHENIIFSNLTALLSDSAQLKEDMSLVLENTALLGDLSLRYPDLTHRLLSTYPESLVFGENSTLRWAVQFADRFGMALFNNSIEAFYHEFPVYELMKLELNLVKRSPNYSNPFSMQNILERQAEEARLRKQHEEEQRKKEKRLNRGPKLTGVSRKPVDTKKRLKTEL